MHGNMKARQYAAHMLLELGFLAQNEAASEPV
jgi:hypothetical protein